MTAPKVTLLAPRKVGSSWVLGSEVALGDDKIVVQAFVSPATVRWAEDNLHTGLGWATEALSRARGAVQGLVRRGDWGRFGPLGELAASIGAEVSKALGPQHALDLHEAARLYKATTGELGPRAAQLTEQYIERISADSERGVVQAIEAARLLVAMAAADEVLHSTDCYSKVNEITRRARQGEKDAALVIAACRALGRCKCEDLTISFDVELALYGPSIARDIVGYATDVFALRGLSRGRRLSMSEVGRVFSTVLGQAIPPSIAPDTMGAMFWDQYPAFSGVKSARPGFMAPPDDSRVREMDPYARPMPYYGAGYTGEEWGSREGAGGYPFNPDELARRGQEWGY